MRRWLLLRLVAREWFGRPPERGYPGERVLARLGPLEVERLYGDGVLFGTASRLRDQGVLMRPDIEYGLLGLLPWFHGSLALRRRR